MRVAREIAFLSGHARDVFSAAFSPDGSRIVTASMGLDRPHLGRRERQGEIGTTSGLWVVGPGLGRSRGLGKLVNSPSLRPDVLPSARFGVRVIFMFHLFCVPFSSPLLRSGSAISCARDRAARPSVHSR